MLEKDSCYDPETDEAVIILDALVKILDVLIKIVDA